MKTIAVLVGSVRAESINLKFAKALAKLAHSRFTFDFADIGSLPMYNDDLWKSPPETVLAFKRLVESADAVLFVTPEYNRSIPAVLKNAIDWGSRPVGKSSWRGKPGAIVGTSPGAIGTAVAQAHLRTILPVLDIIPLGQPEVYFQTKPGIIDEHFAITDEKVREFLSGWAEKFDTFVDRVRILHA